MMKCHVLKITTTSATLSICLILTLVMNRFFFSKKFPTWQFQVITDIYYVVCCNFWLIFHYVGLYSIINLNLQYITWWGQFVYIDGWTPQSKVIFGQSIKTWSIQEEDRSYIWVGKQKNKLSISMVGTQWVFGLSFLISSQRIYIKTIK